ncbi:hypothetical protein NPIL_329971 [Nephila pilipes]|uniref:Uncharacterized protein n=1 Tax=Nephila pilipes TaxID=299642 RepID=A0A8X6UXE5_NEPPI|nr:hypothetical protein NPIL_329971 [Nephila pilipes]
MSNFALSKEHLQGTLLHYFIQKKSAAEARTIFVETFSGHIRQRLSTDDTISNDYSKGMNSINNILMANANSNKVVKKQKQITKRSVSTKVNPPLHNKKHYDKRSVLVLKQQMLQIQIPDHPTLLIQTPQRVEQGHSELTNPNRFHTKEKSHEKDFSGQTEPFYPRTAIARLNGANEENVQHNGIKQVLKNSNKNDADDKAAVDIIIEKKLQKDSVADLGQNIFANASHISRKMSVIESSNHDHGTHQHEIFHEPQRISNLLNSSDENKIDKSEYSPVHKKANTVSFAKGGESLQEVFEKDEKIQESDPITGAKEESRKVIRKTSNTISEDLPRNFGTEGKKLIVNPRMTIIRPQEKREKEFKAVKLADESTGDESDKIFSVADSGKKLNKLHNIYMPNKKFSLPFSSVKMNPFSKQMKYPSLTIPYANTLDYLDYPNILISRSIFVREPQQSIGDGLRYNPFTYGFRKHPKELPEKKLEKKDINDESQELGRNKSNFTKTMVNSGRKRNKLHHIYMPIKRFLVPFSNEALNPFSKQLKYPSLTIPDENMMDYLHPPNVSISRSVIVRAPQQDFGNDLYLRYNPFTYDFRKHPRVGPEREFEEYDLNDNPLEPSQKTAFPQHRFQEFEPPILMKENISGHNSENHKKKSFKKNKHKKQPKNNPISKRTDSVLENIGRGLYMKNSNDTTNPRKERNLVYIRKKTLEILLPSNFQKVDGNDEKDPENTNLHLLKTLQNPLLKDIETNFMPENLSNPLENIPYLYNDQKKPDSQMMQREVFPTSLKGQKNRVQIEFQKLPFEIEVKNPKNRMLVASNNIKRYSTPLTTSTSKATLPSKTN